MAAPTGRTPKQDLPYPIPDDNVDVPRDIKALADKLDPLGYVPPGAIMMWLASAAPAGWYLMKGQGDVSAASNPGLVAIFGQTGGFVNMPDWQGRMPLGTSTTYPTLGSKAGVATVQLTKDQSGMPAHRHTISDPGHDHGVQVYNNGGSTGYRQVSTYNGSPAGGDAAGIDISPATTGITQTNDHNGSGASQPHDNMPPYVVVNYIVRAG